MPNVLFGRCRGMIPLALPMAGLKLGMCCIWTSWSDGYETDVLLNCNVYQSYTCSIKCTLILSVILLFIHHKSTTHSGEEYRGERHLRAMDFEGLQSRAILIPSRNKHNNHFVKKIRVVSVALAWRALENDWLHLRREIKPRNSVREQSLDGVIGAAEVEENLRCYGHHGLLHIRHVRAWALTW